MGIPRNPADAQALASAAEALYTRRVQRQNADEDAWRLLRPILNQRQRDAGDEALILTDCAIQADAAIQIMAEVKLLLKVAANPGMPQDAAQRQEDMWRWWMDEVELRQARGLQGYLRHNTSWSGTVLGAYAGRLLLSSDPGFPWDFTLLDPRCLFPDTYDGPPNCIVHKYAASPHELERYFGKAAVDRVKSQGFGSTPDTVTCTAFYSDTEMGILVGNEWLKPLVEHRYGFNPIIYVPVGGAPFRGPRPNGSGVTPSGLVDYEGRQISSGRGGPDAWDQYTSVSFLRAIRPVVEDMQKIALMQRRLLEKQADPVVGLLKQNLDLTAAEVPRDPGQAWTGQPGDAYIQHTPDPSAIAHAMQMRTLGQASIGAAGLNPQLLGGGDARAGFDRFLLSAAGLRPLKPYLRAQGLFWTLVARAMFKLFVQFWPPEQPIQMLAPNRETGAITFNPITPQDVLGADTSMTVEFGKPGDLDKVAMGNLAMGLKREGLGSPRYLLSELMEVDNPIAVLQEQEDYEVDNQPQIKIIRVLTRKAAEAEQAGDQQSYAMYSMLLAKSWEQFTIMVQPQPPPQPPMPGMGQPSGTLPDEMGPNAGLPPNTPALAPEQVGAAPQAPPPPM